MNQRSVHENASMLMTNNWHIWQNRWKKADSVRVRVHMHDSSKAFQRRASLVCFESIQQLHFQLMLFHTLSVGVYVCFGWRQINMWSRYVILIKCCCYFCYFHCHCLLAVRLLLVNMSPNFVWTNLRATFEQNMTKEVIRIMWPIRCHILLRL